MSCSFIQTEFREKTGGFTLLEMVITLAIFILLSAAVFGIITGVLRSASVLQDNQNRRDQLMALNDYLSQQLKNLPANGVLLSYRRGDGEGLNQNGIIFGQGQRLTALDGTKQANGYYTVRVATFDPSRLPKFSVSPAMVFETEVGSNDSDVAWTSLIHDVQQVDWKFQILNATDWLEMWSDSSNKPALIEFTLEQAGDAQPSVMDFWLPHLEPISIPLVAPTSTPPPVTH
jgi:type II secretory pathway pseudopilin PulG